MSRPTSSFSLLSISIVNYKSSQQLLALLRSLDTFPPPLPYEIIIWDNSPTQKLENKLKKNKRVQYYPSKNIGFGAGHNAALTHSKGDLLLILNPDSRLLDNSLWSCLEEFELQNIGIVAPRLENENKQLEISVTQLPSPWKAMIYYSWIDKYLPNNSISQKFWYRPLDDKNRKVVGLVSGAAFFISAQTYQHVSGFDEKFFMYFEDVDLCQRAQQQGLKVVYQPKATLQHTGGASSQSQKTNIGYFQASRYYYFRKHFSLFSATALELFLRLFEFIAFHKQQFKLS